MVDREIRVRVGQGKRLECRLPKSLTHAQLTARRALILELAESLRALPDPKGISRALLRKLALATEAAEVPKLEKAIRRFIREPAESPAEPTSAMTFREFALHWATGGLADEFPRHVKKLSDESVSVNKARVLTLCKTVGNVALVRFTKADADRALDALPAGLSNATVRHYAQVMQTVLRRAVHPGNIIPADRYPLPLKWLPPTGTPPTHPILYPRDVVALLRSPAIPAWRRMLYAFAIYEGMRLSHMLRLTYANVDFSNGFITVGIGKNNSNARTWKLNAGTLESLVWFRGDAPTTDRLFPALTKSERVELSRLLRDDLVVAGVTREVHPDLFANKDGQAPVRFHDLRATFVSLHLAMGWSEVEVMMRTQHTSTKVLHHHYARRLGVAKAIIEKQGRLPPMDDALGLREKPSRKAQRAVAHLVDRASGRAKGGGKGGGKKRVRS